MVEDARKMKTYYIEYFFHNRTEFVDDGTWSTTHVFFAAPLTEQEEDRKNG